MFDNVLEKYGWGLSKAEHVSPNGHFYVSETFFIQHVLLKDLKIYKGLMANGVGNFFIACDNNLIPEARKNSWLVPQMLMLKRKGMFQNKNFLQVDFSVKELKLLMKNMKTFLDSNMNDAFAGFEFHYAAMVWLNRMTYDDGMFELLTSGDEGKILNTIKYMYMMQIDSPEMVECFQDACSFNSMPDVYAYNILK